MEKRIKDYLAEIDVLLKQDEKQDWNVQIQKHLTQIAFFQHERLVHLIVTVVFALLEMMSFLALQFAFSPELMALSLMILILLIPYIRHYYILENGVQKMYKQYDKMMEKIEKKAEQKR